MNILKKATDKKIVGRFLRLQMQFPDGSSHVQNLSTYLVTVFLVEIENLTKFTAFSDRIY